MPFIDFQKIKAEVPLAQAIDLLGLTMKKAGTQWRGACPACKTGGDRALVVTDGKAWYCFAAHSGGDVIALAAHAKNCSVKDAAQFLAQSTGTVSPPKKAKPEPKSESEKSLAALTYLEHDHAAVLAIGFDPEVAKRLGIGYAPKGIMRGTVAIPVRDEAGVLQGYVGIEDAKLPPDFMANVVSLDKRRA